MCPEGHPFPTTVARSREDFAEGDCSGTYSKVGPAVLIPSSVGIAISARAWTFSRYISAPEPVNRGPAEHVFMIRLPPHAGVGDKVRVVGEQGAPGVHIVLSPCLDLSGQDVLDGFSLRHYRFRHR